MDAVPHIDTGTDLPQANGKGASLLQSWLGCLLVVTVTCIVFMGVTKLGWTNWDDDVYVYDNPLVLQGDYRHSLVTPVNYGYNPLPAVMFAWEWQQVKDKATFEETAWLFHFNNLWLHMLCTGLVFWLMRLLGLNPLWAAVAALLYGIHPMRVESVAWITERKDVMYGTFYVAALISYVKFLDTRNRWWVGLTAVFFVLAMLSKVQAVALPLSLLAIDWYRGRGWKWRVLAEKAPFVLGSIAFGLFGLYVMFLQVGGGVKVEALFGPWDRFILGLTAYANYFVKMLVPYENTTFYPYPLVVGFSYYLWAVGGLAVMAGAYLLRNISRETTFGIAFFTVNIVFLLSILDTGSAYMSDRLTYVPYIGLTFSLCMVLQRLTATRRVARVAALGALGLFGAACAWKTISYIPTWQNSEVLWTDVIETYPQQFAFSYINRAQYYERYGQPDRAMADLNVALATWPDDPIAHLNRGNLFVQQGQDMAALTDYTKVIEHYWPIDSTDRSLRSLPEALRNRGAVMSRLGMRAEALIDLDMAIQLSPNDELAWMNRGITYFQMGRYQNAINDFTVVLRGYANVPPGSGQGAAAYDARGVCYMMLQKPKAALDDFNRAIQSAPNQGTYYANRAQAHSSLGNINAATADFETAKSLGQEIDMSVSVDE